MNRIARRALICAGIILVVGLLALLARETRRCRPGDDSIKIGDRQLIAGCAE